MLPKINRVKKKRDFEAIFKEGLKFKNNLFILRVAKNHLNENRIGFVVSLKVSKKATVRNKIRRRLAEAVKVYIDNIERGTDLVFIVLPGAEKNNFFDTKNAVSFTLNKAKLIKNV